MLSDQPTEQAPTTVDELTIEEVKAFIADAKKKREDWLNISDKSWREIKKRNKRGQLYGGNDLDRQKRQARFPLWWSCWQIRKPIVFARLPIPVLKDTQGDDPFGRTACVIGERFTRSILKTFDAFTEISSAVDDFLITNFAYARCYYSKTDCVEDEKVRLQMIEQPPQPPPVDEMGQPLLDETGQPLPPPPPLPPIFLTPEGEQIPQEQAIQDDLGYYFVTGQKTTIESEEVCFKSMLYNTLCLDPDARKWSDVSRIAIECPYSYREFIKVFGRDALDKLGISEIDDGKSGKPLTVYEYHDKFLKQVRWFTESATEFFQPKEMMQLEEGSDPDYSDLYGLTGFYPTAEPLVINQSTDEYWPTSEYFQTMEIIDDIHAIVNRMWLLTRAIRVRFLFDSSVTELKQLAGEVGEGGGLGIPNLQAALMNDRGTLSTLVAYFPVTEMITGLQNMYQAFEQRLNMFYQITGISDLIRGQTDNGTEKTYGERQMEGKFALNRIEPFQRKVQEWIKDNYQLLMEMGLKLFTDETIDEYITPQTLDQEDQQRYIAALELLKSNKRRRFRVEFETDTMISINEQYKKKQAIELANTLTKAMEAVAQTAQTMPELAATELAVLKHMIGEFGDGKLFVDEIQDSIQQVIEKVNQPKEPEPNVDQMKLQFEQEKLQFEREKTGWMQQFEQQKLQANFQIESAKLQQTDRLNAIEAQVQQFKIQGEQQLKQMELAGTAEESRAQLEKEYQKIGADIQLAQQELALKRDELLVELRKIADKKEVDQFSLMIDERVSSFEAQLETARLELEKTATTLDLQERFITEQRLQAEHQLQLGHSKIESLEKIIDVALKKKELETPVLPEVKPEAPAKKKKKRSKIVRDKNGDIAEILQEED